MRLLKNPMLALPAAIMAIGLWSCASMGRPEGGPRDVDPPLFVRSNPSPGQTDVTRNKIRIEFNENVQLKDQLNKVVISPAQTLMPQISAAGHYINIELRDTMLENTTYTIDFSDAISDLNEGNEIDGFSFAFSTGPVIDSLQISGMVFEASTLEPAQGMLVGVYSNLSDTAIHTLPLERITKTNQLGQFTVRNLKPGEYRIYALTDQNRDYHWDRSEDVAFYDVTISPEASHTMRADTLQAADGTDSIVERGATLFTPNDILLTWFNENYQAQYLAKYERSDRNRIKLELGAPSDTFPGLKIVGGPFDGRDFYTLSRLETGPTRDTLDFWITDTLLLQLDSIQMATTYLRTDTLDRVVWTTDTLNFNLRGANRKNKEEKKEKKKKKDEEEDSVPQIEFLQFSIDGNSTQPYYRPLMFKSSQPLTSIDQSGIHLSVLDDTVWVPVVPPPIEPVDTFRPLSFMAPYEWEHGAKYRMNIDSLAIQGVYGMWNKPLKFEFTISKPADYSTLKFNIEGLDSVAAVVQLLNSSDVPVMAVPVIDNKAEFANVAPSSYYARLFIDSNGNGVYDTGSLNDLRQPEETYYYNKKIPLKKNWEAVVNWDINELPIDLQKPTEIKKNKPKKKAGETPEGTVDEEDDDTYYAPGSTTDSSTRRSTKSSKSSSNSRLRRNSLR